MNRKRVSRAEAARDPYLLWNSFVDVCFRRYEDQESPIQRIAHLAMTYEDEVCNGGHFQYFENSSGLRAEETADALEKLGALGHRDVLRDAIDVHRKLNRPRVETVDLED